MKGNKLSKEQTNKRQLTFRLPEQDYKKLLQVVGPFGSLGPLLRFLISQHLQKAEREAA